MQSLCVLRENQTAFYVYKGLRNAKTAVKTSYLPEMQLRVCRESHAGSGNYDRVLGEGGSKYGIDNAWCLFDEERDVRYQFQLHSANPLVGGQFLLETLAPIVPNGHEPPDYAHSFNGNPYRRMNNCYTYALCMWLNPLLRENGLNPGELSQQAPLLQYLKLYFRRHSLSEAEAVAAIIKGAAADLAAAEGEAGIFRSAGRDEALPTDCYKVALVLSSMDYHWYRQLENGLWVHKPGRQKARYIDDFLEYISDPAACFHPRYPYFGGYFAVSLPVLRNSPSLALTASGATKMDKRLDLTEEELKKITLDMDLSAVRRILGAAHDQEGSGLIKDIYYTVDGIKYTIFYIGDLVSGIDRETSFLSPA